MTRKNYIKTTITFIALCVITYYYIISAAPLTINKITMSTSNTPPSSVITLKKTNSLQEAMVALPTQQSPQEGS